MIREPGNGSWTAPMLVDLGGAAESRGKAYIPIELTPTTPSGERGGPS